MGMYKLTATKTVDGITSTLVSEFATFALANAANWNFQDCGYTVKLVKVA